MQGAYAGIYKTRDGDVISSGRGSVLLVSELLKVPEVQFAEGQRHEHR